MNKQQLSFSQLIISYALAFLAVKAMAAIVGVLMLSSLIIYEKATAPVMNWTQVCEGEVKTFVANQTKEMSHELLLHEQNYCQTLNSHLIAKK